MKEKTLPRIFALILLLISLAMLVPLGFAVSGMLRGETVAAVKWTVPLVVLATGAVLIFLLSRKESAPRLFLPALALWILAAGYFLFS